MIEEEFLNSIQDLISSGAQNLKELTEEFSHGLNRLSIQGWPIEEVTTAFKQAVAQLAHNRYQSITNIREEYIEAIKTVLKTGPKDGDVESYENTLRNIRLETFVAVAHDQDYYFSRGQEIIKAYKLSISEGLKKHNNSVDSNNSTSSIVTKADEEKNSTGHNNAVASLSIATETNATGDNDVLLGLVIAENNNLEIANIGIVNLALDNCG